MGSEPISEVHLEVGEGGGGNAMMEVDTGVIRFEDGGKGHEPKIKVTRS